MKQSGICSTPADGCDDEPLDALRNALGCRDSVVRSGGRAKTAATNTIVEPIIPLSSFLASNLFPLLQPEQHLRLHRLNQIAEPRVAEASFAAVELRGD